MRKSIIAPSILNSDIGKLESEILELENSGADYLHIDVMDGCFVPPITFGDNIVALAKRISKLKRDVHVMIANPEKHLQTFISAGAESYSFHIEASNNPKELLQNIRQNNLLSGLALKPETDFENAKELLEFCDILLIMTVNPGYGGQKFMADMLRKVSLARSYIEGNKLNTLIQVDGGIDSNTGKDCFDAGADILVAGTFILNSKNYASSIKQLRFSNE